MTEAEAYRILQAEPWLVRIRIAAQAYERAQNLVAVLQRIADGVAGIDYSEPNVAGGDAKELADRMDGLVGAKRNAEAAGAAYRAEVDDAARRLSTLEAEHQTLLGIYYLEGRQWHDVAEEMGYSESRIYQMRREALLAAYEVMPTEWRDPRPPAI